MLLELEFDCESDWLDLFSTMLMLMMMERHTGSQPVRAEQKQRHLSLTILLGLEFS
jgi:hypothetical protein